MRKATVLLLAFLFSAAGGWSARAQTAARLELYALHTASFPAVSVSLDVFDPVGNFVTGLAAEQITLLEDEQPQPLTGLQELQPGVQFVLALDAGPAFAFRDTNAVTRFEKLVRVLANWTPGSLASPDDLSLVATGADPETHLEASAFLQALMGYQPNLLTLTPSIETLTRALAVAGEPAPEVGMKRVLLYVTSVPAADSIPLLQNLTQQAVSQHVRVHVWIVASTDFFNQAGATALKDLALATGGQVALFSGEQALPDLETYLAPLRHMYALSYESALRSSGGHTLAAQVSLDGEEVSTPALAFELSIEPPNPILVSPPTQIVRQAPEEDTTDLTTFLPRSQSIEILIEFPDGRSRPLVRTALLVDGLLADENTDEPFERFTWDLSSYSLSGDHILTVEASDSLGLSRTSIGVPVTVTVVQPQAGLLAFLVRGRLWLVLGVVGLAGLVLAVSLAWGQLRQRQDRLSRTASRDPVTQPIQAAAANNRRRAARGAAGISDAFLLRLKENGEPITAPPIPISTPEMTFGSDPLLSTRILDDPSVSALHARLVERNGEFVLTDEHSAAGTWVNYEPLVSARVLRHGDILHFGRPSYRFMRKSPPEPNPVRVIPLKR